MCTTATVTVHHFSDSSAPRWAVYPLSPAVVRNLTRRMHPIKKISPTNSFHINLKTEIENGAIALSKLCSVPERERSDKVNEDIREAERAINKAVGKLYRLTPAEINLMENY